MPKYKSPEAYILKLESFNTYLSIPSVLSLNSVKKFLEPILLDESKFFEKKNQFFSSYVPGSFSLSFQPIFKSNGAFKYHFSQDFRNLSYQ